MQDSRKLRQRRQSEVGTRCGSTCSPTTLPTLIYSTKVPTTSMNTSVTILDKLDLTTQTIITPICPQMFSKLFTGQLEPMRLLSLPHKRVGTSTSPYIHHTAMGWLTLHLERGQSRFFHQHYRLGPTLSAQFTHKISVMMADVDPGTSVKCNLKMRSMLLSKIHTWVSTESSHISRLRIET